MLPSGVFPKILIVASFPPGAPGGGAWLLDQLLRGVPADRVAWWSAIGDPSPAGAAAVSHFSSGRLPPRLEPQVRFIGAKGALLETLWVPWAARRLKKFIRAQRPDLIWIIPFMWAIPVLHRVLPSMGIPWHISLHDFSDASGGIQRLGLPRARRFHAMTAALYRQATSRDVISPAMAEEMERTTGQRANAIIRCGVEPEQIARIKAADFAARPAVVRIGYAGTITAEKTFARFVEALKLACPRMALPVEIHLFGTHSYRHRPWFDASLIVEHGYLPEAELQRRLGDCTWGLAMMDMNDENPRYNRFSFPCKFTTSLAAGLPTICLGHEKCSLIELAQQYRLGLTLTSFDPASMADELERTLGSVSSYQEYQSEILRCIEKEFCAASQREMLHGILGID